MDQKKYYTVEEAAQILGLSPAEVNLKREANELRGFRDGASWKYKVEDVEALLRQLRAAKPSPEGESADVLLSDLTLEGAPSTGSGTVIGPTSKAAADSDIQLADSGFNLAAAAGKGAAALPPTGPGSDLEIILDDDALLDDSQMSVGEDTGTVANVPGTPLPSAPVAASGDSSGISLADSSKKLDDDDIVLGGGSSGSDITIGGDSGISLLDPTDSGLSLEEPLELGRMDEESLELGEDDMLTFAEDTGSGSAVKPIKKDEEFLLTPLEETADEEESESGSQVIALDSAPVSDSTATMIASPGMPLMGSTPRLGGPGMAAMLDEDFAASTAAAPGLAAAVAAPAISPLGAPMGMQPMFAPEGVALGAAAVPEAPYTGLNITALIFCLVFILLCGVFAFDLMRNMWSWSGPFSVSSWLMNLILGQSG